MSNVNSDTVEYQILMEATKAVQDLEKLTAQATTADEKIRLVAVAAVDFGQKIGISGAEAEAWFKRVEKSAIELQATMANLKMQGMPMLGQFETQLMETKPIFPAVGLGEGATQATVSAEMYKGVHTEIVAIEKEQAAFDAEVKKTNADLEAELALSQNIAVPIRTAGENMARLSEFAKGSQGQGILTNFLGSYSTADTYVAKIGAIKTAMTQMKTESGASLQQVSNMFKSTFTNIPTGEIDAATKQLNTSLNEVPESAGRAVRALDAVRIALGAIVAMIVFQVIQAFTTFFSEAIKQAREFEGVLYNVANAEKIMSMQGIEIAPKDFQDMIDKLRQLVPMLSQLDATKAVGNLALFTKDLGYTKDQIGELADAIGVLYIRNRSLGLSFEQVQSQVQTGILTGRAQGIRDLGVSISEDAIKFEALRLKLVETEKEFNNLSGDAMTQVKAQAMLSIILKGTNDELKSATEYQKTNDAAMSEASSKIKDIGATIGKILLPAIGGVARAFNYWQETTAKNLDAFNKFVAAVASGFKVIIEFQRGHILSTEQMREVYQKSFDSLYQGFTNIYKLTGDLSTEQDTATGSAEKLTTALQDMSKVDLSSLNNSLLSLQERLSDLNRDFAQKNQNYIDEFNTKMDRMQEDYNISVQNTLQEFNNRRADLEAQYRNAQLEAEAKYQEQMRELRAKYLYDLEDALRNRDARQVLRLQAQYKMDKENLTKNFEIENAARARQYATELAQLRRQESQKLAEMAAAEKLKEARAREDFAREQAQRKQEYENQLADLKRSWDDKLAEEAQKIGDQYGLNEKGVDALHKLLNKYYGTDGVFDGLYTYSLDSLTAKGADMLAEMASIIAQYQALANTIPGGIPNNLAESPKDESTPKKPGIEWRGRGGEKEASGGIEFANHPRDVTFGDAGPEAAIFLPLGKSIKEIPNNLPPALAGGGLSGMIRLAVDLHPDLVTRITENTLKEAANITTHVYRRRS